MKKKKLPLAKQQKFLGFRVLDVGLGFLKKKKEEEGNNVLLFSPSYFYVKIYFNTSDKKILLSMSLQTCAVIV